MLIRNKDKHCGYIVFLSQEVEWEEEGIKSENSDILKSSLCSFPNPTAIIKNWTYVANGPFS